MRVLNHFLSYILISSFVLAIDPPQNLEAVGGEGEIQLQWDAVEGATSYGLYQVIDDSATTTTTTDGGGCAAGEVEDCSGDGDCCPESWIGDGYTDCEDQQYGCDLTCYDNDGGDCAPACPDGQVECWDGSCAATTSDCPEAPDCGATFTVTGSDPTVGDCYTDGSGYFSLSWEGGCLALTVNGQDVSAQGFTSGFYYTGFPGGATETFEVTFEGGSVGSGIATNDCASCADQGLVECEIDGSCAATEADCPQGCADLGAFVDNCNPAGGEACCPESWIGDGYADCEDQQYGCDLSCYDNDGGDCGGVLSDNSGLNEKQKIPGAPQIVDISTHAKNINDIVRYDYSEADNSSYDTSYSREESGYSDTACATTLGETDPCDGWVAADVNNDYTLNVLDIVLMVDHILEESLLDGCPLESADGNNDGNVDVLDVVYVVNSILGEKSASNAKSIKLNKANNSVVMSADGFIAAIDMTLSHSEDFVFDHKSCELNSLVCGFNRMDHSTRIIIVNPNGNTLFNAEGDFEIVHSATKAANSNGYIDVVTVKSYSVSNSYPNPFNPSTSFSLELSSAADVSVNVYNIMGQLVDVLAQGNLSAQTHNFTWNADGLSSGVYFIKTQVGADVHTQKVMLMK